MSQNEDDSAPLSLAESIRRKIAEAQGAFQINNTLSSSSELQPPGISSESIDVGSKVNSYELHALIHKGDATETFEAKHTLLDKIFVAKVLAREHIRDSYMVKRFQEEVRVIHKLDSIHVVKSHDFGMHTNGQMFMILDFISGTNLKNLLNSNKVLPLTCGRQVIAQLGSALSYLHENGVKYANLKPGHVMIQETSNDDVLIRLVDFSCARREESLLGQTVTTLDGAAYMSPEQFTQEKITAQADVYSLGCLAFEILTGLRPLKEKSQVDFYDAHSIEYPKPEEGSFLTEDAYKAILRATDKTPSHRHATVQEFVKELLAAIPQN